MRTLETAQMRPIFPEWYNEIYAIERHGYRWMSFIGIPVRRTPDYPNEQRVRQLLSAEQLEHPRWKEFLEKHEGREADGTEPLSYDYCSSACNVAQTPDLLDVELAVDLSRCVHKLCKSVPHNIGLTLIEVVREHLNKALVKNDG